MKRPSRTALKHFVHLLFEKGCSFADELSAITHSIETLRASLLLWKGLPVCG